MHTKTKDYDMVIFSFGAATCRNPPKDPIRDILP